MWEAGLVCGWASAGGRRCRDLVAQRLAVARMGEAYAAEAALAAGVSRPVVRKWRRELGRLGSAFGSAPGSAPGSGGVAKWQSDEEAAAAPLRHSATSPPATSASGEVQSACRFRVCGMDPFSEGVLVGWCSGGTDRDRRARLRFLRLVLGEKKSVRAAHRAMASEGLVVSLRTLMYWSKNIQDVLARRETLLRELGVVVGVEEEEETDFEGLGYQRVA